MRLMLWVLCLLAVAGVFVAMFHSILSEHRDRSATRAVHQRLAVEIIWATIPCLMVLAATAPAVVLIVQNH